MAYRKIDQGNPIFKSEAGKMRELPPMEEVSQNITSFIRCIDCGSEKLFNPCNCYPLNYECSECGWMYNNHTHQADMGELSTKDISQTSLLTSLIRK